jgi:hypothetical protein
MALRWRKNPKPNGLARVGCGPQGSTLFDGENEFARVAPLRTGHVVTGWYWVSRAANDVLKNTCDDPAATESAAKEQAMAYVRKCLKAQTQKEVDAAGDPSGLSP